MRKLLLTTCLVLAPLWACAQSSYTKADSVFICKLLKEAAGVPRDTNMPLFFARKFLGKPYVAHTLEVCDPEQLVINTRQLDCTTLVENVVALTLTVRRQEYTFEAYEDALRSVRYRQGEQGDYTSRLHYFSDWINDNQAMSLVREVQQPVPPFVATQVLNVNYMSTHPTAYRALSAHPQFLKSIIEQEYQLKGLRCRYIPKENVKDTPQLRQAVHDGDIIAITCNKPGLDIAHLGLAVWHKDGLHLLNASQLHKKVVEEPMTLGQYLSKHPSHTGIRVIRINR